MRFLLSFLFIFSFLSTPLFAATDDCYSDLRTSFQSLRSLEGVQVCEKLIDACANKLISTSAESYTGVATTIMDAVTNGLGYLMKRLQQHKYQKALRHSLPMQHPMAEHEVLEAAKNMMENWEIDAVIDKDLSSDNIPRLMANMLRTKVLQTYKDLYQELNP